MNFVKQIIFFTFLIKSISSNEEENTEDKSDHECEYINESKDMMCHCFRSSLVIPSLPSLLAGYPGRRVESLSFTRCSSLDLNISTVGLDSPLYQIRVDNIEYVTIRGVVLKQGDGLDIHVNNVNKHFNLIGDLKCTSCTSLNTSDTSPAELSLPSLSLQIKDTVQANIQYVQLKNLHFRLKSRNVKNIIISNSVLSGLQNNGMEIFYSEKLEIKNSVFKAASNSSLLLNHVNLFSLDHTIGLSNDTFEILSPSTMLEFSCTIPLSTNEGTFYIWDTSLCGPPGVSLLLARRESVISTGGVSVAVVMTGLAAVVLAGVILVILYLHKRGKLDSVV